MSSPAKRSRSPLRRKNRSEAPVAPPRTEPQYREICHQGMHWIYMEEPTGLEQQWLDENFGFHPLSLEDVLSKTQRPKVDEHADHLFIVLHFPVWDRETERLSYGELDIFVGADYLITSSSSRLRVLEALFQDAESSSTRGAELFERGPGYLLYTLVDLLFDRCFPMLAKIGHKLDGIEDQIFADTGEDVVREISAVKQEIITFRRTMRPQGVVIRDLERTKRHFLSDDAELEYYFDDVQDASSRIWDLLENYKEVLTGLQETNEAVIGHRVNEVLRALTAISVVVLPLTLVASIWGMNVGVPGESSTVAFWVVTAGMIALLCTMLVVFKKKHWL